MPFELQNAKHLQCTFLCVVLILPFDWIMPLSAKLGLKSFGCLVIINIRSACRLALARHCSRRSPLNSFFCGRIFTTGSPSVMNLSTIWVLIRQTLHILTVLTAIGLPSYLSTYCYAILAYAPGNPRTANDTRITKARRGSRNLVPSLARRYFSR